MKCVKLSVLKPSYAYFKLTPNVSLQNTSTHRIARTISSLYTNIWHCISVEEAKVMKFFGKEFLAGTHYEFKQPAKIAYYVYIEKNKVEFYFIVASRHTSILLERIKDVWSGVTIEQVNSIPEFSSNATMDYLVYQNEDALSLETDRRNNDLLNSNLSIIDVLQEGEKAGILYNFLPCTQFGWFSTYKNTIQKVRNNAPVERNKLDIFYVFKIIINLASSILNTMSEVLEKPKSKEVNIDTIINKLVHRKLISQSTIKKGTSTLVNTQIVVMSESQSRIRQINNAKSLAQSFDIIAGDNKLVSRSMSRKDVKEFDLTAHQVRHAAVNKVSDIEAQNFIGLPGRQILDRYKFISNIPTQQTQVPKELRQGIICLGENLYKGTTQTAYLSTDREYQYLTHVCIGPTRAGKSTVLANITHDAVRYQECVILFDFCGNCELSDDIASSIDNVLEIRCDDFSQLQGLGYNEVKSSKDVFEQYRNAKMQSVQLLALINSVNSGDKSLAPRMERYLSSAALVAFIQNGSINDVFSILQDHKIRNKMIASLPVQQATNVADHISNLKELDDIDKTGKVVGTRYSYVMGIFDRLQKLRQNSYMELMLKKSTKNNVDLTVEIQKPQLICLRMPEVMFSTDEEKDIYCTYWMTKIILALQFRKFTTQREQHTKVNIIIDEIYQIANGERYLTSKLSRIAKYRAKIILSCHYINQLKHIREELRSANTSYSLISGCDKKNFDELKDELYPYTVDDLLHLPRYHSLNCIKYTKGYAKFITRLPKPLASVLETY